MSHLPHAMKRRPCPAWLILAAAPALGCTAAGGADPVGEARGAVGSAIGTLLTFSFDGRVLSDDREASAEAIIDQQLHYSIGQLNGWGGVSSPATARLTEITETPATGSHHGHGRAHRGGPREIRYHAELPVAWPSKGSSPESFSLRLPLRVDAEGEATLLTTSSPACFESLSESGTWYSYRPDGDGCSFVVPIVTSVAAVSPGPDRSSGRYPELSRIWEDGSLDILAVFRKDVAGSTSADDIGRKAFTGFIASVAAALGPEGTQELRRRWGHGQSPTLDATEITLSRVYPGGRRVNVVALLEDAVAPSADTALLPAFTSFLDRYTELGPTADVILYEGHSGLGDNVRSITRHATFLPGRYQLFYLDACDSFAYLGGELAARRAALTPADPAGTSNLDVLVNAMPATFAGMPAAAMSIVQALLPGADPRPFEQILEGFDPGRVGFVIGDEDNGYRPSRGLPDAPILSLDGEVDPAKKQEARALHLPAGDHVFEVGPAWGVDRPSAVLSLELHIADASAAPPSCATSSAARGRASTRCAVHLDEASDVTFTVRADRPSAFSLAAFTRPARLPIEPRAIDQPGSRQSTK